MPSALGATTAREAMTMLAESFPSLRGKPGAAPWDQFRFAEWASSGAICGNGQRQAAAFVLSVWNGCSVENGGREKTWWNQKPYRVGTFDAVAALVVWDDEHRAAFLGWCRDPFWP